MKLTRRTANIVLLVLFILFFTLLTLSHFVDALWLRMLLVMAEAGLIGGIADWYAVTALFRHPLGIRTAHTSLISRYRRSFIESITRIVSEQLLRTDVLESKLSGVSLFPILVQFLDRQASQVNELDVAQQLVTHLAPKLPAYVRSPQCRTIIHNFLTHVKSNHLRPRTPRTGIAGIFQSLLSGAAESLDVFNVDQATEVIIIELERLASDIAQHEPHVAIEKLIASLSPLLKSIDFTPLIRATIYSLERSPEDLEGIEQALKHAMLSLFQEHHGAISAMTREALEAMSPEQLSQLIESKALPDLVRIRLNGSLVGVAIGLLYFGLVDIAYAAVLNL